MPVHVKHPLKDLQAHPLKVMGILEMLDQLNLIEVQANPVPPPEYAEKAEKAPKKK